MAENKKSFVLYADYITTFEELADDEAGKLIKHILRYVNDQNPEPVDKLTKIAFEPIKQQLKRDLVKWGEVKNDRSKNGAMGNLKRWNLDLYNSVLNEEMTIEEAEIIAKGRKAIKPVAKIAVNDTVTVNVNDTVIDSFNTMPTAQEIFELPEIKINSAIQLIKITKGQDVAAEKIIGMWQIFKEQNLTGKKYYADVGAIHSHFINWIKTQKFETNGKSFKRTTASGSQLSSTAIIEPDKTYNTVL